MAAFSRVPNSRNSGPFVLAFETSAVPTPTPGSFCYHMYVSVSPLSASVALPLRVTGVRYGMVYDAGADTTGAELPVGVISQPWFCTGPPCAVSPVNALTPDD